MAQTSGGTGGAALRPADPTLLPQVNVTGDAETAFCYGEWCAFGFGRQVFAGPRHRW
ncbi:hypothetical protein [Roseomonas gilardii]|uniref:hypothetical protein n=1 Tax=Roseomonas gilardii TaxID=257708 RepID=UPI001643C30A|nr:hypothetical protein [Roseomonas gilardii]